RKKAPSPSPSPEYWGGGFRIRPQAAACGLAAVITIVPRVICRHLFIGERGIEGHVRRGEIELLDEFARFAGAVLTVHAGVFPFDAQGPGVVDVVEGANDLFEIHAASTRRTKIPAAAGIAKIQMARENSALTVEGDNRILDVHVID